MSTLESFSTRGRRALVTGASTGIGAAIALALAESGADIFLHHFADASGANAVAAQIKSLRRRVEIVEADLSTPDAVKHITTAVSTTFGAIDILVSNAAIQIPCEWRDVTRADFDQQIAVNVRAPLELIQAFAPAMLEKKWGRIVMIGSVQEAVPHPQMLAYAASKCAQVSLVHNFARQFAAHGVTVNNLAPGTIYTERNRSRLNDPAYFQKVISNIPVGRIGEPTDCAGTALLLCSDTGAFITGQTFRVDGGASL